MVMIVEEKKRESNKDPNDKNYYLDIGYHLQYGQIGLPEVDNHIKNNYPRPYLRSRLKQSAPLPPPPTKEDRISKLPDDILHFIISHLTMRERATTCILSRRWTNLWIGSVSKLFFTDLNMLGHQLTYNLVGEKEKEVLKNQHCHRRLHKKRSIQLSSRFESNTGFLENQRTKYIKRVNCVLELFRSVTVIDSIVVRFALVNESSFHVDRWVRFAAARGATSLQLDFQWGELAQGYYNDLLYLFPFQEFASSSLRYLGLARCIIQFPPNFQGLHSLVSLTLVSCDLTGDKLQAILSNCPSLEYLSVKQCCFPDFTTLSFVGPSMSLKHLDIGRCRGISDIELRDLNLLSFELQVPGFIYSHEGPNPKVELSIRNCPFLTWLAVHFDSREASIQTLTNVPHLVTLSLCIQVNKMPMLSALSNLKRLMFSLQRNTSDLFEVLCFLEACPILEKLHVDMGTPGIWIPDLSKESSKIATRLECRHSSLKEVEIYGFHCHSKQIELAKYLLKTAMVLEKMKLCTYCKVYFGQGAWRVSKKSFRPLRMPLEEVSELLGKEKRANTEVLIVSR